MRSLTTAFLVVTMLVLVDPAAAQVNRPDLVDLTGGFTSTPVPYPSGSNSMAMNVNAPAINSLYLSVNAHGMFSNRNPAGSFAFVEWSLFSPDLVKRKNDIMTFKQKRYLWVSLKFQNSTGAFTSINRNTSTATLTERCLAKVHYKKAGDLPHRKILWQVKCKPDVLTATLGLTATQLQKLSSLLPAQFSTAGDTIKFKGKSN